MADVSLLAAPTAIDVDSRPALLVSLAQGPPAHVVLLEWAGERIAGGRDFAHARYTMDGAEFDA